MSDGLFADPRELQLDDDPAREEIASLFLSADPQGTRLAAVFRKTFNLLYDGQHTGRYRWDQLMKTEKTHYGSMFEINLRRAFNDVIDDVTDEESPLDYRVSGHDIDCKFSQKFNGWMLPPECFDHLLLVATANDEHGTWSLGLVRASEKNRRSTSNRDQKTQLNARGAAQIRWLFKENRLPPNLLLNLSEHVIDRIFRPNKGQSRILELCRLVTGKRIDRNTIATVAQQDDYMARIRDNGGGARTVLREEGYLIAGDYTAHQNIARKLGQPVPQAGEIVSFRVVPASENDLSTVELDGRRWRAARPGDEVNEPAPRLPTTRRSQKIDNR